MDFILPDWPAPNFVKACTTCASIGRYDLNHSLGLKDSPEPQTIAANRRFIQDHFHFKHLPWWLDQTHSAICHRFPENANIKADASLTRDNNQVLAILTADCLPILISHKSQAEVAAIHAGWRGLYQGIIQNTIQQLQAPAHEYLAWLGPAICQDCYGVDESFKQNFCAQYPKAETCFTFKKQWHFGLKQMAKILLNQLGLTAIYDSHHCTYENPMFYSYRRDQGQPGRIASLIWMEEHL